ncbi:MAG: APC family permease [Candidatus Aramenus sp.]|nr:APC family permease [Candidatus Aramenus sp.]
MRLAKGSISLKETYGQAMAVTAPLGSVVSTTTAAILYAGDSVVFTTLLALLGSALWIFTLTGYTSKLASAGGYYTYGYSAWKSKKISFFEAMTEAFAYSFLNAVNSITIYLLFSIALSLLGYSVPAWVGYLVVAVGVLYPTLISLTHVKQLLGYVVSISATLEAVLLVVLFGLSLTRGFHPDYFTPSNTSVQNLAEAFVLSMVSISGAGAATYLGEETKKPTKNVTAGMWMALAIGGITMLLGTYALVALWNGSLTALANNPQPLLYEMFYFGSIPMAIALILSINSLLSSNIGTTVGAARILFNLARENAAPKVFSRVNKAGEPIVATLFVGGITAAVTISSIMAVGIDQAFQEVSLISGLLWLTGRVVDGFGVPVFYYRIRQLSLATLLIPIVATSLNLWGIVSSLQAPDLLQSSYLATVLAIAILWYSILGRKGRPGSLVVDENNELIVIDEYIERIKKKVEVPPSS